ncbi:hypothetical protein INR49_018115 [Caranx melampygus]|nr:hypothetical protein INR49_018115 [Caranx melampygus]
MRLDCISIACTVLMSLAGVLCNSWKVEYLQQRICAVKGSTVAIPCLFYYPANLRVKSVKWGYWARKVFIIATVPSAVLLLTVAAAVVVRRRLDYKKTWAPQKDCEDNTKNAVYLNWPQVGNQCEGTPTDLLYVTVDFSIKRKPNMQQHMDSHNGDDDDDYEGVVYTSVCRDQNLNL